MSKNPKTRLFTFYLNYFFSQCPFEQMFGVSCALRQLLQSPHFNLGNKYDFPV